MAQKVYAVDDSFVSESGQFDLTLTVDSYKIHVSKAVLCVASPVFRTMFESEFKEKGQDEITLPGKSYVDFTKFLGCIYPDRLEHVTGETVYKILPLAIEYQVKVLQQRCHTLLIKMVREKYISDATEIYRHIKLAELYNLDRLRSKCISIASEFKLDKSIEAERAYAVSDKALVQIKTIAIKRYELDRTDDDYLFNNEYVCYQPKVMSVADYRHTIRNVVERGYDEVRAVRLCLRYFPENKEMLGQCVQKLKDALAKPRSRTAIKKQTNKPQKLSNEEEIELLPEMVKLYLSDVKESRI